MSRQEQLAGGVLTQHRHGHHGGARIACLRMKISMTLIAQPQRRQTNGSTEVAVVSSTAGSGRGTLSNSRAFANCFRRSALAISP